MEGLDNLLSIDITSSTNMSENSTLASLVSDKKKLAEAAQTLSATIVAPGQMAADDANTYMASIRNLFPGEQAGSIELALACWAALQDVGGSQDFASKDPVIVGQTSVPATKIFGEIIPVDNRGLPRKFCSTRFEASMPAVLDAMPALRSKLTPKAIKAGLSAGDELKVISFVRGVTPSTVSGGGDRQAAKDMLLHRRPVTQGSVVNYNEPAVREVSTPQASRPARPSAGHSLF